MLADRGQEISSPARPVAAPDCRKPANANDYQLDYLVTICRQ
jgi:hypothetical protein